ncbi:MAG: dihydropyrimidinase [Clostridiales bacterium]|nr:dihydropyrimidinase [Clostridiales bacterium]
MRILITGGQIVRSTGVETADILTENGLIQKIAPNINARADRVIDASGCLVFAGFIDTHTHFDLDLGVTVTADNFSTGTRAALVGGTTTVLDFATQDRGMSCRDALDLWHKKAQGSSCNYGFHMALSEWNAARAAELPELVRQGVTSLKMYMVYDAMRVDDGKIYRALKQAAEHGCLVGVHCENYDLLQARTAELLAAGETAPSAHPISRPGAVEAEGVSRLMYTAQLADAPVWVVHLSTAEGLAQAERARARGQQVLLETCPQYLCLTDACYSEPDAAKFVMSPPLRKPADIDALLGALQRDEIDVIGTDHCSFTMAQKAIGADFSKIPNGGAGVQNRAEIVYTYGVRAGKMSLVQMAETLSETAARYFGMYPRKGLLREGADADIVIFDPDCPHEISHRTNLHNCDNSPYEGIVALGKTRHVILGGKLAVEDGKVIASGLGQFVHRGAGEMFLRHCGLDPQSRAQ